MKVLPLSTDEYNLEITSDNKLSKLEACHLGLLNTEANKHLFTDYADEIKIDNALTMLDKEADLDLYIANKLSGIYEPECKSKELYDHTRYFINTIECAATDQDSIDTEPASLLKVATVFDTIEKPKISAAGIADTAKLAIVGAGLACIYYIYKNPSAGAELATVAGRLSQYLPRFSKNAVQKYGNGLVAKMTGTHKNLESLNLKTYTKMSLKDFKKLIERSNNENIKPIFNMLRDDADKVINQMTFRQQLVYLKKIKELHERDNMNYIYNSSLKLFEKIILESKHFNEANIDKIDKDLVEMFFRAKLI